MDLEITAKLKVAKVGVKVEVVDGANYRRCRMTLEAEIDGLMAAALGKDAMIARDSILKGGMSKVEMPIDSVQSEAHLEDGNGKRCSIPVIRGIKAVVSRGRDVDAVSEEDDGSREDAIGEPTAVVRMEFEFSFSDDAWLFLGRAAGAWADVKLRKLQQELPGLGKTARVRLEAV